MFWNSCIVKYSRCFESDNVWSHWEAGLSAALTFENGKKAPPKLRVFANKVMLVRIFTCSAGLVGLFFGQRVPIDLGSLLTIQEDLDLSKAGVTANNCKALVKGLIVGFRFSDGQKVKKFQLKFSEIGMKTSFVSSVGKHIQIKDMLLEVKVLGDYHLQESQAMPETQMMDIDSQVFSQFSDSQLSRPRIGMPLSAQNVPVSQASTQSPPRSSLPLVPSKKPIERDFEMEGDANDEELESMIVKYLKDPSFVKFCKRVEQALMNVS
jgi:hypothetical protein